MKRHRNKISKSIWAICAITTLSASPALTASAAKLDFDLNGVAPVVHTINESGDVTIPAVRVEFNNMTFEGWNTSPTGNGKSYDAGDTISSDTTLYAQWTNGTTGGGGEEPDPDPDPDPDPGEDEKYAELNDLQAVTVTVDDKLLSSFNPLVDGTYTVPGGSNISLNLHNLDLDVWSYTRNQPDSGTLVFTMIGKTKSGNDLVVTYTFKAERTEPDPGEDDDGYAKLSDLNVVAVTVNGESLADFDPTVSGQYTIPAGASVDLDASKLNKDYWTVNKTEDNNSVTYALIGTGENNQPIIVTYEFIVNNGSDEPGGDNNDDDHPTDSPDAPTGDINQPSGGDQFTGITGSVDSSDDNNNLPGSPIAGFTDIANIRTAAPLAAIASGALAVLAVIMLTSKKANRYANRSQSNRINKVKAFFAALTHSKVYLATACLSTLAILGGTFYLTKLTTEAASGEDWGIYVDEDGEPYEGFFTVLPENYDDPDNWSKSITTWWKGGQKQYGETKRGGYWVFFERDTNGVMARDKIVTHDASTSLAETDPSGTVDRNTKYSFYYGDDGHRTYGEFARGDDWYHFDETTGIMTKGWYDMPANDVFNYKRKVCYDPQTGIMIRGGVMIDPMKPDLSQYGSLYEFDPLSGNATWHIPNLVDTQLTGKYPEQPSSSYPGDRRQRVLYAALSRVGARYDGDRRAKHNQNQGRTILVPLITNGS